jgi:hypothetical protein
VPHLTHKDDDIKFISGNYRMCISNIFSVGIVASSVTSLTWKARHSVIITSGSRLTNEYHHQQQFS